MWRELWFDDEVDGKIQSLMARGVIKLDDNKKRFVPKDLVLDYNHNWLHVASGVECRKCWLWKDIFFDAFGLIPEFCRLHCYKVVAKIGGEYNSHGVREAIQLHGLQQAIPYLYGFIAPMPGKVGYDARDYTDAPFDAFWYANGYKQGIQYYEIVQDAIRRHMGLDDIPVVLKRACTEMEATKPTDDPFWDTFSMRDREIQDHYEDMFEYESRPAFQPEWLKNRIIFKWLKRANGMGDKSGSSYVGSDIFTVKAVTYHDVVASPPSPIVRPRDKKGRFTTAKQEKKP